MENICDGDHQIGIPQDVFIQILLFLPVISLLRFKSVCKSWRALIQSSFFIDLHLNTLPPPPHNSNFGTFIFQTSSLYPWLGDKTECELFMLSSGSGSGSGDDDDEEVESEKKLKWEDIGFPPCYKLNEAAPGTSRILMVGSCNGLICIVDTKQRDVSLWNPATRQFRILSKSLTLAGIGIFEKDFAAFGYDVKTKDYKVVQISSFIPYKMCGDIPVEEYIFRGDIPIEDYIFRVQVYNLSTDSWRLLEGIDSFPGILLQGGVTENHGVYLNGIYYFLAGFGGCEMIISFDFTKEIFTTILLPDYYDHGISPNLTYLGEKLAVFATLLPKDDCNFNDYDIWVLSEHGGGGVKESWTKIHSIQLNNLRTWDGKHPRSISNDGDFALISTRGHGEIYGLLLFNLVTKEVKKEFRTHQFVIRADVYKQSLVSICGNGAQHPVG